MAQRIKQVVMIFALLSVCPFWGTTQESNKTTEEKERQQNLNREMTLEREYDPIVQDATKITTLPAIREMNITKRPIAYSNYALPMLPDKDLILLPPGKLMTDIPHSKHNGYLHLGGGMLFSLLGDVGYHVLNTEQDRLSLHFSHRSTNGNVVFKEAWLGKRKAQINDNLGGLDYTHHFNTAILSFGGNFGYSAFNYYGKPTNLSANTSWMSHVVTENEDTTTNQGNRLINAYAAITSNFPYSLGYHFGIDYTNFDQKYSLSKESKGMTENHTGITFGLVSPVRNGQSFGADIKANILSYTAPVWKAGSPVLSVNDSVFKTHVNATLNPYYRMEINKLKLLLGLNLMLVSQNDKMNVFVSPNIDLEFPFAAWSVFYTRLGGGVESNSMAELSRINRYINPEFPVDASKTWADLKLGVRSSAAAGFWFDIFTGYKYTESDVFFNPSSYPWINEGFNNVSMVYQPTSHRIQVGATIKYDYQHIVDFYLKGVYDHYRLKNSDTWKNSYAISGLNDNSELKAYGRPAFTGNAGINVRPIKPLTFNLDYYMMAGMYAGFIQASYSVSSLSFVNKSMKDIHDLRFRASWKFNDRLSVYAQFNNVLFQKQDLYYGYPLQPFTAIAGLNFNF